MQVRYAVINVITDEKCKGEFGCRPDRMECKLLFAAQSGDAAEVDRQLQAGVSTLHSDPYNGATALFLASYRGFLSVVKVLVARDKSDAHINAPHSNRSTPLAIAARFGHASVVTYLVEETGAKVHAYTLQLHAPVVFDSAYACWLAKSGIGVCSRWMTALWTVQWEVGTKR